MASIKKKFKHAGLTLLVSVFLLTLALSIPAVQNRVWSLVLERLSERTGWTISARSLYFAPWGKLYAENVYVGKKGRQLAICRDLILSFAISKTFPFVKPQSLSLLEPFVVLEVDETGRLIWPALPSGKRTEREGGALESLYLTLLPDVRLKDGKVGVLRSGMSGYHISSLSGEILPYLREAQVTARLRLEGLVNSPMVGRIRLNGALRANEERVDVNGISLEIPDLLAGKLQGFWSLKHNSGRVSLHVMYFDPLKHPYTRKIGRKSGTLTVNAGGDIDSGGVKGFIRAESSSGFSMNALFTVSRNHRADDFLLTVSGHYDLNGFARSSGSFSMKGYYGSGEDYYAVVDVRCGPVKPERDFKEILSSVETLNVRIEFFPGGIAVSPASVDASQGRVWFRGSLLYGEKFGLSAGVEFSLNWFSVMKLPDFGRFKTGGRLTGRCGEGCGSDLKGWIADGDAFLYRNDEEIELSGSIAEGNIEGKVNVRSLRLDKIFSALKVLEARVEGTFSGEAVLKGTVEAPDVSFKGLVEKPRYGDYRAEEVRIVGRGRLTRKGAKSVHISASGMSVPGVSDPLMVKASLTQRDDELGFHVEVNLDRSRNFLMEGNVFHIWSNPEIVIEKGILNWSGNYRASGEFRITTEALIVSRLKVYHGDGSAGLEGRIGYDKSISFNSLFDRFPLDDLVSVVGFQTRGLAVSGGIKGSLKEGGVNLKARLEAGKGSIRPLRISGISSEEYFWDAMKLDVTVGGDMVYTSAIVRAPYWQNGLMLSASVPVKIRSLSEKTPGKMALPLPPVNSLIALDPERSLECKIRVEEFDLGALGMLYSETMAIKGRFTADLSISGKLEDLRAGGWGKVRIDEAYLVSRRKVSVSEVEGEFLILDNVLKADAIKGRLLDGSFELKALVPLRSENAGVTLSVRLREIHIPEIYGISGVVSGSADGAVRGREISIAGKFTALKAFMDLDALQGELSRDVRSVEIVAREGEAEVIEEGSSGGIYDRMSMDVDVDFSQGNARVKGLGVDAEVDGRLSLRKRSGEALRIYGSIEARRGLYAFQSVRLKITEGEVRFKGMVPPDPDINFTGEKSVDDVVIRVSVVGRVSQPVLKLSSSPAMSDVDILSYLLFNRPARNLTAKESVNLQQNAAFFIGSKAAQKLKEVLGNTPFAPDVLEIYTGESGHGVVEVGKYITPDFYVTYEKDIKDEGNDQVKIEYRINRHLSVQSQIGDERGAGVDVLWRYDFGE